MNAIKVALGLASASLLLVATTMTASGGTADCNRIVVTGHPHYAPVSVQVGDTLEGGAISLVRRLAEDAGVPVTVLNAGSWEAAQKATADGTADIIVGIYKTPERERVLAYVSPAIADDPSSIVAKAGTHLNYKSWSSLVGKKGLVSEGESYGTKFDRFMERKLTVEKVKGFPALFDSLVAGKGDYGLIGYYAAMTGAPKGEVKIVVKSFASEPMYIAFGKKSACRNLEAAFSKGIRGYVRNGTVERLWKISLSDYEMSKGE